MATVISLHVEERNITVNTHTRTLTRTHAHTGDGKAFDLERRASSLDTMPLAIQPETWACMHSHLFREDAKVH